MRVAAVRPLFNAGKTLRSWTPLRWALALALSVFIAAISGIPTGVVPTSLYHRMTPVQWWDYPVWVLTSALLGMLAASYVRTNPSGFAPERMGRGVGAGLASTFAVGCPVCNKIVVALVGVSGALRYFEPLQPVLGAVGVVLLAVMLVVRLRGEAMCPSLRAA